MQHANPRSTQCLTVRWLVRGVCLCVLPVLWLPAGGTGMAAEPVLKSLLPSGARPGDTIELQVRGDGLQDASQLHFSQPAIRAEHIAENRFRVTVAEDALPGPADVCVVTPDGLSAPRRFLVDTLPWSVQQPGNDSPETAQALSLPCILDGRFERAADVDWYRFAGREGQSLTIQCQSASLDGSVEPAFRLLDPSGRQLVFSPARLREPYVHVTLPVSGDYTLRVCDRAYQHDDQSHYRLKIAEGPFVVAAFPHTLNRSASHDVSLIGFALGDAPIAGCRQDLTARRTRLENPTPGDGRPCGNPSPADPLAEGFYYHPPDAASGVWLRMVDEPVVLEAEHASSGQADAQSLSLPAFVAGQLLTPNETDWYRFSANKGETLEIEVYGERLGQWMDLDAAVHDADGKLLSALPDKPAVKGMPASLTLESLDPSGTWKAPRDGDYRLAVRDLYGGSLCGPQRGYSLRIGPARPRFQVALLTAGDKPHGLSLAQGGETKLQLVAIREGGFEGPITVRAEELPPGVTWQAEPLEDKQLTRSATLSASADAELGVHPLRLVAEGQVGEQTVARPVVGLTIVRAAAPAVVRRTGEIPFLVREP